MEKHFITADALLIDSFKLAQNIYLAGFKPHFIIGIWRGGSPIAIAIQEYMEYMGIQTDHIAVRTSSYYGIDQQHKDVKVYGLDYVLENIHSEQKLLIVDDVFDSGRSINAVIENLSELAQDNLPKTIKIACPWFKPTRNMTSITPDFFIHKTDQWLVFPHELKDLSVETIRNNKSKEIADTLLKAMK